MKQVYTSIILLIVMVFSSMTIAQEGQKRFINYQGVARNAHGTLMSGESMTIGVKLNFGSSGSSFEESHDLTTDANGVFSLMIGNGNVASGEYGNLPWGDFATTATISINGNEIGTTELMAVPHALSSADNQWHTMGDDIENKNGGNVFVTGSLYASKDLSLAEGAVVNEFSADITLGDNSDEIVPTQKAVKTYVDSQLGGGGGGTDDQTAAEVAYDNSTSGLTATTAQTAIDELVSGGVVDADSDPTNELQTISFDAGSNKISLTDGGEITIPTGGTDADADPNNEIQDISLSGTKLTISEGSTIDLAPIVPPGGTDDQNLILTGDVLSIENGSGSVDLSTYAGDDADADPANEIQDISLVGTELSISDGSTIDLAPIVPPGGMDNQNLTFNETTKILEIEDGNTVNLSSLAGGGGSSLWTQDGSNINYASGRVGIGSGSESSNATLEVAGAANSEGILNVKDTEIVGRNLAISGFGLQGRFDGANSSLSLNKFGGTIYMGSDVGIGLTGLDSPESTLDVDGNIRSRDLSGGGNVVADANGNLIIGAGSGGGSSNYFQKGSLNTASVNATSIFKPIGAVLQINKQLIGSTIEVTVNSRFRSGTFSGTNGVKFQIRVDGTTADFDNLGSIRETNTDEFLSMFAVFHGLSAGIHSVRIYVQAANGGTSSGVLADPGGWGGKIIAKETF